MQRFAKKKDIYDSRLATVSAVALTPSQKARLPSPFWRGVGGEVYGQIIGMKTMLQ